MSESIKRCQKGMSLIEMVVAIAIFIFCLTGFSFFYVKIWKANSYIYEAGQDTYVASRSVNLTADEIKMAAQAENGDYPIKSASDFEFTVYVDDDEDGKTEKIHYFLDLDTDILKKGISEPTSDNPPSYSEEDDSVETITSHVVNEADDPVFSYFGRNFFSDDTPFDSPVSSEDIMLIKLVKVKLLVDVRPYHSPDHVAVESFAQLRNLKDYEQ
jgi:hypothetical protein